MLESIEAAIRDLKADVGEAEEEQTRRQVRRDLEAQEGMVWWAELMFYATAATVLLTGIALVAIIRTLHHTRRAAESAEGMLVEARGTTIAAKDSVKETRDIGEAQVRAYISVVPESSGPGFVEGDRLTFMVRAQNTGATPARKMKVFRVLSFDKENLLVDDEDIIDINGIPDFPAATLASGQPAPIPFESFLSHSEEDLLKISRPGGFRYYAAGIIIYEDVFNRTQKKRFCLEIALEPLVIPGEPRRFIPAWMHTAYHNDET